MLHLSLLAGRTGEIIVGISGIVLLTGTLTGIWIAWPQRRNWKSVFDYKKWRKIEHILYGWHRAVGLVIGLALIVGIFAGAIMVFEHDLQDVLPDSVITKAYHPAHAERFPRA